MPHPVTGVKGAILRWARETQGISIEDVAAEIGREPDEIESWEAEEGAPTYAQLEKLAYGLYKRPLAVFFLPQPPPEPSLAQEFRTLPDFEIEKLSPDTRYHLRLARSLQISLYELHEGVNPAERKIFNDLDFSEARNVGEAAARLRSYLEISLTAQIALNSNDAALKAWRLKIEECGVYVFKSSLKQRDVSGFSLDDETFPLIYLNNSTPKTRQIFTLFHELTHLLTNVSSITKLDQSYLAQLSQSDRRLEQFCNAVTAECLVPSTDFSIQIEGRAQFGDEFIGSLADRYHVSRETILRRLLTVVS
jgi:Zn-dependent peptidase ImmA (M78 family)